MIGLAGCSNKPIESNQGRPVPTNEFKLPQKGDCPDHDTLEVNRKWVEHKLSEKVSSVYKAHLDDIPIERAFMQLISTQSIDTGIPSSYWIGMVTRSNQLTRDPKNGNISYPNSSCSVVGTVAVYIFPGDFPHFDLVKEIERELINGERRERALLEDPSKLGYNLLEVRWYDPSDQKRHRWFNSNLANRTKRERRLKMEPLSLPRGIINTLY